MLNQEPIPKTLMMTLNLVAHAMSCTIDSGVGCAVGYGSLCFGSLDEVIKVGDFVCLNEGKG